MSAAARIGLLLLGLLALAGALHAPLHADEAPCSPAALCAGGGLLGAALVVSGWILILSLQAAPAPRRARQPRDLRPRLTVRGRAPPRA